MIRTVCVCVCPLPALLKIEPGCTDCHTHADMLSLELYLQVGGSQIPYTSHTFPSSAGRKGPAWVPQGMSPGEIKANKVWGKKNPFWKLQETIQAWGWAWMGLEGGRSHSCSAEKNWGMTYIAQLLQPPPHSSAS